MIGRYHAEVAAARRAILLAALRKHGGNRTHAAAYLGLQRTYLLRLLREFGLAQEVPAPQRGRRRLAS